MDISQIASLFPQLGMMAQPQGMQPMGQMPNQQQLGTSQFFDPTQQAQLQADQMKLQRNMQLANAFMQQGGQYAPNSGKVGILAGLASLIRGKVMQGQNETALKDVLGRQFQQDNQAAQAKRAQDLEDEQRKMMEKIYENTQSARGTAQANKEFAKSEFTGGGVFDPSSGKFAPSQEWLAQQGAAEKQKAQIAAQFREAPGAAGNAKMAQIAALMQQPDSPTKTAQLSALLGQGGMEALAFGSMGAGGGAGGVAGAGGEDFLKTLNPQTAAQVKAIGEYRQAPLTSMAMRSPMGQALMQAVNQAYPEYDATAYPARSKARSAFTSGKEGQALNSLNTAIGHAGELLDSADKLGNTSYPFLNTALNAGSVAMGSDKVKNFNLTRDALAGEMTKAFRGAGGSEKDIEEMRANLNAASSPEQLHGAIGQSMKLLGSKAQSLNDQYTQAFGQAAPNFSDPHAKAALQKLVKAGVDLGPLGDAYGLNDGAAAPAAGSQLSDAELLKKYGGG